MRLGPILEARDEYFGLTPLHVAAGNENRAATEALLAAGADVAARDDGDKTPLHWAAWNNEIPAVTEALLAAGANLEARDEDGNTPLHLAANFGEGSRHAGAAIEALLEAGANEEARKDVAELRERMAKLEGALEGFLAGRRDRDAA